MPNPTLKISIYYNLYKKLANLAMFSTIKKLTSKNSLYKKNSVKSISGMYKTHSNDR